MLSLSQDVRRIRRVSRSSNVSLTALAKNNVAASTQNQAYNAIIFFYAEVLGARLTNIQALRAKTMGYLHAEAMSVASPLDGR
jgi:integrase-like protein